jgi:hypothetical protein
MLVEKCIKGTLKMAGQDGLDASHLQNVHRFWRRP